MQWDVNIPLNLRSYIVFNLFNYIQSKSLSRALYIPSSLSSQLPSSTFHELFHKTESQYKNDEAPTPRHNGHSDFPFEISVRDICK